MPLVKPRDKEKRKDFLERCMGDQTSVNDFQTEVKDLQYAMVYIMIKKRRT